MTRYSLTDKLYKKFKTLCVALECRHCGQPLHRGDMIESKPTRYHRWVCKNCGEVFRREPKARKNPDGYYVCPKCEGRVYYYGRRLYLAEHYDGTFFNGNGVKND